VWKKKTLELMANCQLCQTGLEPIPGAEQFQRCPQDYLIWNTKPSSVNYEDEYFQTEYRLQYGREYLADKQCIVNKMTERWDVFKRLYKAVNKNKPRLLELGSAAGFFLEIAKNDGWDIEGWEISQLMSEYANHHSLKTKCGSFSDLIKKTPKGNYGSIDCLAAFYVLEHLTNQHMFWSEIRKLLRRGAYVLLSLPSSFGPLFYFNFEKWKVTHPGDHVVDYSPASLAKVAAYYGFQVCHLSIESAHPSRFGMENYGGIVYPLMKEMQKKLVFADTFFAILKYLPSNTHE
jgi:SAM-dependent methyltransferase